MTRKTNANASHASVLNVHMLRPYTAFQLYEGTATSIQNMSVLALGVAQQLAASGANSSNIVVVAQSALPSSTTTSGIAIHFKKLLKRRGKMIHPSWMLSSISWF